MSSREDMYQAIKDHLKTGTGKNFEVDDAPANRTFPYGVIYPLQGSPGMGPWSRPEQDREWMIQITSVGTDRRQASWLSDKIRPLMEPSSLLPAVTGLQGVWSQEIGAIVPSGDQLYVCDDTYTVRMGDA